MNNQYQYSNISQQLNHCEQMVQQLITQTHQASNMYQQLLHQEQANARELEQLAQREQKAAQIIQTALQGHNTVVQRLQEVANTCRQLSQSNFQLQNQSQNAGIYSQQQGNIGSQYLQPSNPSSYNPSSSIQGSQYQQQ